LFKIIVDDKYYIGSINLKYISLIEFSTIKAALEFNLNSSTKYSKLTKVFGKYYLYSEEYDIKDLSYLLTMKDY